jgi:hypothetical protein
MSRLNVFFPLNAEAAQAASQAGLSYRSRTLENIEEETSFRMQSDRIARNNSHARQNRKYLLENQHELAQQRAQIESLREENDRMRRLLRDVRANAVVVRGLGRCV